MSEKEQELLDKISSASEDVKEAKRFLTEAKKKWVDAETYLIQKKLDLERFKEQLRRYQLAHPKIEKTKRDFEIERFRNTYPDVCELASTRDKEK